MAYTLRFIRFPFLLALQVFGQGLPAAAHRFEHHHHPCFQSLYRALLNFSDLRLLLSTRNIYSQPMEKKIYKSGHAIAQSMEDLLDAILMARSTLSQFARTHATAGVKGKVSHQCISSLNGERACINKPSVPSFSVPILASRVCICVANVALKSRNCLKCSSSAFFEVIRVVKADDCC